MIVDLNASPLLLPTIMKRQLPAALILGRAQPQTHEMPPRRWRRVVLVRRARVQDVVVRQELDISNIEDHMQRQAQTRRLEHLSGVELRRRKRRDEPCVGEAREGADVVGIPSDEVLVKHIYSPKDFWKRWDSLRIHPPALPPLQIKHTRANPILLTDTLLPLSIKVPNRLRQRARHIRVLLLQRVPDGMAGDQVGLAAFEGFSDAQEPNEIRVVGVEELPCVGPVDADPVDGAAVFA